MRTRNTSALLAAAALAALTPTIAPAAQSGTVDTSYGNPQAQEEDDRFPWGLLGLLGLLGLMPRKRKETITVDNRTRS